MDDLIIWFLLIISLNLTLSIFVMTITNLMIDTKNAIKPRIYR